MEDEPDVTALGSDAATFAKQYPDADWLAMEGPLFTPQLAVRGMVHDRPVTATLDTGSMTTVMTRALADRIGLMPILDDVGVVRATDAHGQIVKAQRYRARTIRLGHRVWQDVAVSVLDLDHEIFLLGADVLKNLDVWVVADIGFVALFDAGDGPIVEDANRVNLTAEKRQLLVTAHAPTVQAEPFAFSLIVDTGASNTSVPAWTGIHAGLPAAIGYSTTSLAVGGEREQRGRFVLDPLVLGGTNVSVGRVLATASTLGEGRGSGLLGNDVLMRYRTLISYERAAMWMSPFPRRGAGRNRGPGGAVCESFGRPSSCIHISFENNTPNRSLFAPVDDRLCLRVQVHPAFAGTTVEMAVLFGSALANAGDVPGVLQVLVTVDEGGFDQCLGLWPALVDNGDLDEIALQWVRTEGIQWPCDPFATECLRFTGPLPTSTDVP
jgi:predicted aspartyl protease